MGWTFTHKEKATSVKAFFENNFNNHSVESGNTYKVLDCKVVGMKTAYLAVEVKKAEKVEVFAVVCLLDYKSKNHFNFGYKDMSEDMGPYYYDAPKSILDLLTPTTNENSIKWRANCVEVISKNEIKKSLKKGDVIEFNREFSFKGYGKASVFNVIDNAKGHYYSPKLGITVKLTKSTVNNTPWTKL